MKNGVRFEKLEKDLVIKDPCQVSVDFLRERCARFFERHDRLGATHLWFADHFEDMPARRTPDEVIDVIFFGGFIRRFLESGNWLEGRYRFWCLTGSVQAVMSKLLGIPADAIGIIPRREIAPEPRRSTSLPMPGEPITFVFGGRLSATKNLELLVRTVSRLQKQHGLDVSLVLSGDFDDRNHPDRGIWEGQSYERALRDVIAKLPWTRKPRFKHGLEPHEWTKEKYVNPVYINLSTYVYEDFDVSLAQARAEGWPAVISDWGGHRDVPPKPRHVVKVPPAMLGHSHEIPALTDLRARSLAAFLEHALYAKSGAANSSPVSERVDVQATIEAPRILPSREIDSHRRAFIARTGPSAITLYRRGLDGFSYEEPAEKFFAAYRACFAAPHDGEATAVLVNDLHASKDPAIARIPKVCENIVKERAMGAKQVVFIPSKEVLHPLHSIVIANAREILVPFESKHLTPLLEHWVRDLEIPARIFTVAMQDRKGLAFTEVKL